MIIYQHAIIMSKNNDQGQKHANVFHIVESCVSSNNRW